MRFLESSVEAQIIYREWFNKKVFGHRYEIKDVHYIANLEKIFNSVSQVSDFEIFLMSKTGQKWLKTEPGKAYIRWQEG